MIVGWMVFAVVGAAAPPDGLQQCWVLHAGAPKSGWKMAVFAALVWV